MVVTTIRNVAGGTLRPADIACPLCTAKGGLEMRFTRPEISNLVLAIQKPCDDATVHCNTCGHDVPADRWGGPLLAFFNAHSEDFGARSSFRVTWFTKIVLTALLLAIAWWSYDTWQSNSSGGQAYQTSTATIQRATQDPRPGMIWLVDYTRPEDISPQSATSTKWFALVEKAEGDTVTIRLHRLPPPDGLQRFARTIPRLAEADFTGPQIVLRRLNSRSGDAVFRVLGGVETAAHHPNLFVYRIVQE